MGKTKTVMKKPNLLFNCGFEGKQVARETCIGSLE